MLAIRKQSLHILHVYDRTEVHISTFQAEKSGSSVNSPLRNATDGLIYPLTVETNGLQCENYWLKSFQVSIGHKHSKSNQIKSIRS